MASPRSSRPWTLSELLGQRRLLGLGAVLAWLVLFHLLVNVWLLCIFTSLLVVLGGWLGSRALLDANSLLHLEHFLPVSEGNPPLNSAEHERRLNHEIHSAVHKAVRDFVSSWYRTLLPEVEGEFENAVRNSMLDSVMELKERARRVDRKALVQRLLELYGCHLQSYMRAREIRLARGDAAPLWLLYREVEPPHPAVSSATSELNYSRALVNLVLHVLVPYPQMETRTGGYMVTELITCNVLLPLIGRVSDPDWLNQTIVDIFTRSREPQGMTTEELLAGHLYRRPPEEESWTTCRSLSSSDLEGFASRSSSDLQDLLSRSSENERDSSGGSCESLTSSGKGETSRASPPEPYRATCRSPASSPRSASSESKNISADSLIRSGSGDDLSGGYCDCGPPTKLCSMMTFKDDDDVFGCFAPLKNLGPKAVVPEDSDWPALTAQDKPPASPSRGLCLSTRNFVSPKSPSAPVTIQNVQVAGTVSAKEQRGSGVHPYTLYTVKYEISTDGEGDGAPPPASCHTVSRRYSEFLNLQTRLEEKPEVKKFIKNIKGPKKMFPDLSFGNADSEKVEARKGQLDIFLRQLSSIPETAHSEDMQEFLALNADGCTYFGRRPFVRSRIDKMMENALDTLKTAFPYPEPLSPTEELEGDADGRTMDYRKYRRLMFPKLSPSLNMPDLHPRVTYCFSDGSAMLNGMSPARLEVFAAEQERLLCEAGGREAAGPIGDLADRKSSGKIPAADTAMADVALNILCLLMKDQWSWLCTENIQKTIRLLFGTFIERWLDIGVAHLTGAPCWVIYLQVLQEAVWPGGTLPAQPRPERHAADRDEARRRCLECLLELLPEVIADILGSDKYRTSLETMLESLQDPHINKHLLFCICDLLLEFLIPESGDKCFQRSLLGSLSRDGGRDDHA